MRTFLAVIVTFSVTAACGGSPTTPGPTEAAPFRSTAYLIDFIGDSFACGDLQNPQAGTTVTVRLTMQATSNRSVATSAAGGLTLQFQRDQIQNVFSVRLTGTASGFADDEGRPGGGISIPPNGTRLTIDPSVPLTGEMPAPTVSDFAFGALNGTVVFSRGGVTSTCAGSTVRWTLNRVPG